MHKLESVLENRFIRFSGIFRYKLITQLRPEGQNLCWLTKKKNSLFGFAVPADDQVKMKEREKINKYLDLA